MTLTPTELAQACAEVAGALGGRPVQKVVQPDEHTVALGCKGRWLLISAHPRYGRLHLIDGKPVTVGEAAPAFCMLLRKHLNGARLASAAAVAGERAAELIFERRRPTTGAETKRLRLYLYGRSAQLVLADQAGVPLGAIGPARAVRQLMPAARPGAGETPGRFGDGTGLSQRIAAHYRAQLQGEAARHTKEQAVRRARAALERAARLEQALAADRARAEHAPELRRHADLLLAHLREVPRGARAVTLPDDFAGGTPVEIPLDPARSAKDNAAVLYKRYKRLERARSAITARWQAARAARLGAERALEQLNESADAAASAEGESAPPAPGEPASIPAQPTSMRRAGGRASGRRPPYREFRSASGAPIFVGRGADRNEELTFRVARGSDLWLHARDFAGAHVVVPLGSPGDFDEETLLDAATLAAHHSRARDEQQVDVTYTLRKYVRKVPRARGTVSLSQGKTLHLRLEAKRLARLLASRVDEQR